MNRALSVKDLSVSTNEGPEFREVTFELAVGEAAAITSVGPADLRKLLEVLAGLERADSGRVFWNRIPAISLLEKKGTSSYRRYRILQGLRQTTSYVSHSTSLIHNLSICDNVALPFRYHVNPPEEIVEERTSRLLDLLGLRDAADERPAGLPLGITRRAAVARALILEPTIIFLDSPFSEIDNESAEIIMTALGHFRKKAGLAVLAASYEPRSLLPLVSRVLVFQNGELASVLEGEELDVKYFFEQLGRLQGTVRKEDRVECAPP